MPRTDRLSAAQWADLLADAASARPIDVDRRHHDPLAWPGYADRVQEQESVQVLQVCVGGHEVVLMAFDFEVLGGSMGTEAGRRLRAGYDHARRGRLPTVLVSCTGGARMQEGMRSLVQMPGVLAAAGDHADAGLLQIGVAAHPTTGGVYASALTAADVIASEPGAYVSFSGPRVAAALGDDVTLQRHGTGSVGGLALAGQLDAVVPRDHVAGWLARVLAVVAPDEPRPLPGGGGDPPVEPFSGPAWEAVQATRAVDRPRAMAVLDAMDGLVPLVGDRAGGVDPHTTVTLGRLAGRRVLIVAQDHGPVAPAGFRTAQRGMHLAARLGIPVVTLIDTRGAAVGAPVDDAGQAGAIAGTLRCQLSLPVPILAVVVGEGGSGGAIALAAADRLLVQRTATFSVIAPEGAAAILHRDPDRASEVAGLLGLRSSDLLRLGIADEVVADDGEATVRAIVAWLSAAPVGDPAGRRARWRRIADG